MEQKLRVLLETALKEITAADSQGDLDQVRINLLGRKGELTKILRAMKKIDPNNRPRIGRMANEVRERLEKELTHRLKEITQQLQTQQLASERLDITLPGTSSILGHKHPLSAVLEEIVSIFLRMGFDVFEGPEVEYDYYNFEALNIPKHHPARDMQDSFYLTKDILLRTHTSPFQVRIMEQLAPSLPIRVICPGRCYRRDPADATHSPMFYQTEVLVVDRNISFANLKHTLLAFAREMFGPKKQIRLRPGFFPFTEPSAEVDISCFACEGTGCRICKGTGWLEILGSGMVHPKVLATGGYDPNQVSGFAAGMGPDRIAMLKYGIDDIRLFYENDLRFLHQF
jgi:phenylalanyl-tRNA synthetase alpha chain